MIHPGNLLNDTYEIIEQLGSGGSGIIYKAYHRRMRKFVAVKLIKDEIKEDLHNRAEVDVLSLSSKTRQPGSIDKREEKWYNKSARKKGEKSKKACSLGERYV